VASKRSSIGYLVCQLGAEAVPRSSCSGASLQDAPGRTTTGDLDAPAVARGSWSEG
jgi:hypothetical protein